MPIRWRLTLLNALIIGVIVLTLAGTFAYLWYGLRVNRVENTTERQANEAAKALADGEDLLGKDRDELEQATADRSVVILIRNAQGKLLGQMPNKPDFSMEGIDDPVWKEVLGKHRRVELPSEGEPPSEGPDYIVYAVPVNPDPTFDVVLQSSGDKKDQVTKVVRAATGLGLKTVRALVAGKQVPVGLSREEADNLKARLEEVGAKAELPPTVTSSARVIEAGRPYPSIKGALGEIAPVLVTVGILGFALSVGGAYL